MIKIYHNPRCTKSRQGVALLSDKNIEFEEVRYLNAGLSIQELQEIIEKLGIEPIGLIRKNEAIWKTEYKGKDLSDTDILQAMVEHPKLMERPVVINKNKAVIGRPTEAINQIL